MIQNGARPFDLFDFDSACSARLSQMISQLNKCRRPLGGGGPSKQFAGNIGSTRGKGEAAIRRAWRWQVKKVIKRATPLIDQSEGPFCHQAPEKRLV